MGEALKSYAISVTRPSTTAMSFKQKPLSNSSPQVCGGFVSGGFFLLFFNPTTKEMFTCKSVCLFSASLNCLTTLLNKQNLSSLNYRSSKILDLQLGNFIAKQWFFTNPLAIQVIPSQNYLFCCFPAICPLAWACSTESSEMCFFLHFLFVHCERANVNSSPVRLRV